MIQVTVDRVQVLDDRRSHVGFIFEQHMNNKQKPIHNKRKTVGLKAFTNSPLQLPTMHSPSMPKLQNTLTAYSQERKKKLLRGALIVYSVWNALTACKSSHDTLAKPVRLP